MVHKNLRVRLVFKIFLVLFALTCALLLHLYASQLEKETECGGIRPTVMHVTAATDLPAGIYLTDDLIRFEKLPERLLHPNTLVLRNMHIYLDRPLTTPVAAGRTIHSTDFE